MGYFHWTKCPANQQKKQNKILGMQDVWFPDTQPRPSHRQSNYRNKQADDKIIHTFIKTFIFFESAHHCQILLTVLCKWPWNNEFINVSLIKTSRTRIFCDA